MTTESEPAGIPFKLPKLLYVYTTHPAWTTLLAVLQPFCSKDLLKLTRGMKWSPPVSLVGGATVKMFDLRYRQLLSLRERNWIRGSNRLRTYCYPGVANYGVAMRLQSCGLTRWCPFCWGRVAGDLCRRVITLLYADPETGLWRGAAGTYGLVERQKTWRLPLAKATPERLREIIRTPHAVGQFAPLGSLQVTTLEPVPGKSWLLVRERDLLAVERPERYRSLKSVLSAGQELKRVYHKPPVRKNLVCQLVGRLYAYPTGLLLGDPELVLRIISSQKGTQGLRSDGVLRNSELTGALWSPAEDQLQNSDEKGSLIYGGINT